MTNFTAEVITNESVCGTSRVRATCLFSTCYKALLKKLTADYLVGKLGLVRITENGMRKRLPDETSGA
jgi:hypothetical protein